MLIKTYKFFNWRIDNYILGVGETLSINIEKELTPDQVGNQTLYTKGKIKVTDKTTGEFLYNKIPGDFVDTLPKVIPKRVLGFFTEEPTEWWCMNFRLNRNKLPTLTKVIVEKDSKVNLNGNFILCEGSISLNNKTFTSPCEIKDTGEYLAIENSYLLKVE